MSENSNVNYAYELYKQTEDYQIDFSVINNAIGVLENSGISYERDFYILGQLVNEERLLLQEQAELLDKKSTDITDRNIAMRDRIDFEFNKPHNSNFNNLYIQSVDEQFNVDENKQIEINKQLRDLDEVLHNFREVITIMDFVDSVRNLKGGISYLNDDEKQEFEFLIGEKGKEKFDEMIKCTSVIEAFLPQVNMVEEISEIKEEDLDNININNTSNRLQTSLDLLLGSLSEFNNLLASSKNLSQPN